jgi:TonB family protein
MNHFFLYLFHSSACVAALWFVYWLFLGKETYFRTNRFYLLVAAVFSLLLPLMKVNLNDFSQIRPVAVYLDPIVITPEKIGKVASGIGNGYMPFIFIYLAGVAFFIVRFLVRLVQLARLARHQRITTSSDAWIVTVNSTFAPFSFFRWVFVNHADIEDPACARIINHEMVHVKQWHSADLILSELMLILQWFNPFAWLLVKAIKTNHEYLADEGVLHGGESRREYQELLLTRSAGIPVFSFANNFNVSLLKKRIVMMTKTRSTMWAKWKVMFALPAFLMVLFLSSAGSIDKILAQNVKKAEKGESITQAQANADAKPAAEPQTQGTKTEPQKQQVKFEPVRLDKNKSPEDTTLYTVVENQPSFKGGQEAMVKFLMENIQYPPEAKKKGVQGTVFVQFVVKADGSVTNVKVLRGIGSGCDEEAFRVVKLMPKWNPGTEKGKPVSVAFNLPIKFKLDAKGGEKKPVKK